jgi:amino acid adenylation domain-containing protein
MNKNDEPMFNLKSLVDLLMWQAEQRADNIVFDFLHDGEEISEKLSYFDLHTKAQRIAALLAEHNLRGERALLLYQPNLDYIAAFFGCLYAGVIAVPAYPPRNNRNLGRLQAIIDDAQAKVALTSTELVKKITTMFSTVEGLKNVKLISTNEELIGYEDKWSHPNIPGDYLAFLQYTSGSTGNPKGVMLSHANLLHNLSMIKESYGVTPESSAVSWLPPYHDMGLIGALLGTIYGGAHTYYMPPAAFLQRPMRLVEAISKYKASISGGPNFMYDLLVNKATPDILETLDLSRWNVAFNGAEPVRQETLERFAKTYEPCGFNRLALFPCYGLAESSVFVCSSRTDTLPVIKKFDKKGLEQNNIIESDADDARTLVGSGHWSGSQVVKIVDPETRLEVPNGEMGEVWVKGGSISSGYWNRKEASEKTFQNYIADTNDGPYLATEDRGFFLNEELFIAGRIKDLIIVRGVNHYPQDIERTVEVCHPDLRLGGGAAFSVEVGDEEKLVIAHEVDFRKEPDIREVAAAMQLAVAENHDLQLHGLVLVKPGRVPKTSSGKIQRYAARLGYENDTLDKLDVWHAGDETLNAAAKIVADKAEEKAWERPHIKTVRQKEIERWIINKISSELNIPASDIDVTQPFARYGLDSARATGLAGDLEEWLDCSLPATLAYDYPTIEALSQYLSNDSKSHEIKKAQQTDSHESIAIIGMGCRFPGAQNLQAFWKLLVDGVDAISEVTSDRWDIDELYDPEPGAPGKVVTKSGGFIKDVDKFDASFFGISPREANRMDPQQRLAMEVSWETLEDAGYAPSTLGGSATGVFVGVSNNDYSNLLNGDIKNIDTYTGTGNAFSIVANRLSYFYDFRGPSMSVDTACSSSLVAMHQAIKSLRSGETNLALAGGVNLVLSPEITITFSHARLMSPDGRCKTFDASANGYSRGEGCGFVALKRLSDAERDGDNIYAVIRGSAVNQDGRSNGITAPNGLAQQDVIRLALQDANVDAQDINYIEAHGTGTILGDPIEVKAIAAVMQNRPKENPCLLGSVKTNIGHLESAAGVAGVIKTALALNHKYIPSHLHFKEINPHIPINEMPLEIITTAREWQNGEKPRRAGISSFGFGGTNSHIILEEAKRVEQPAEKHDRTAHLLAFSSKIENGLRDQADSLKGFVKSTTENCADICFTANVGRDHFKHRMAVVAADKKSLFEKLNGLANGQVVGNAVQGSCKFTAHKIAFLFTGQGSQYLNMGKSLYDTNETFRAAMDRCDDISKTVLDKPILSVIFADDDSLINETTYTQPALFTIEYALATLWQEWGVRPDYVMGHSIGELVAAHFAGVFGLEDAFKLVAARGRLMGALPRGGKMAAIFADVPTVTAKISQYKSVDIAGVNGPNTIVISGTSRDVDSILAQLQAQDIEYRELVVSHAFHSAAMDPMLDEFEKIAAGIEYKKPTIPIVSNVTGKLFANDEIPDAAYWRSHIRQAVLFSDGMTALRDLDCDVFVEIGPNPHLIGMGRRSLPALDAVWAGSLKAGEEEWSYLLQNVAQLYVNGLNVEWAAFDAPYSRAKVRIPTYAFQRERYWLEQRNRGGSNGNGDYQPHGVKVHPLLGYQLTSPMQTLQFQNRINGNLDPYLHESTLFNMPILPPSAFVEMGISAGRRALKNEHVALKNVKFVSELLLSESGTDVQFLVTPDSSGHAKFQAYSLQEQPDEKKWVLHAQGDIVQEEHTVYEGPETSLQSLLKKVQKQDIQAFYHRMNTTGICLENDTRVLNEIYTGDKLALAKVDVPQSLQGQLDDYEIHPLFWDACCQTVALAVGDTEDVFVADGFDRQINYLKDFKDVWTIAVIDNVENDFVVADTFLINGKGHVLNETKGARYKRVDAETTKIFKARSEKQETVPVVETVLNLTKDELMAVEPEERHGLLASYIRSQLATILSIPAAKLDKTQPVTNFGLDSIMAVELQVKLEKAYGFKLPVAKLIVGPTIEQLTDFMLEELAKDENDDVIQTSNKPEYGMFPLSKGQEAMWVQHQMAPKSIFNPVYAVRIRSEIDLDKLNIALQAMMNRHPALRTTFHYKNGEQIQHVHEYMDAHFVQEDASQRDGAALQKRIDELANETFDLTKGPLFRTTILLRSVDDAVLVIAAHHIIMDMWSLATIISELSQLYATTDANFTFLPSRYRYTDYVAWQHDMLKNQEGEKLLAYWTNKLSGTLPALELPTDFARPAVQTFNGKIRSLSLGRELTEKLKDLSDERGVTLYMTLLAAFKVLLHKYTGEEDIIVGTPTTGRSRSEFADIVGYFVNSVALRTFVDHNESFADLLTQVQATVVDALAHQDYPFFQLVEKLKPTRDASRTPIFQSMFVYQRAHVMGEEGLSSVSLGIEGEEMMFAGHPISVIPIEEQVAPFDMTWMVAEASDGLGASLTYNTDLYQEETILRLLDQYKTLLESIVETPQARIAELQVVPYSELYQVLFGWNDTHVALPDQPCIQNLFEEKVAQHPDAIAVHFEGQELTFAELDAKANQLAHFLQHRGVGPETVVGLCVDRSLETVIGLLGILKANGAYMPLDPAYPLDRLQYMIEHSHVQNVVTMSALRQHLPDFDGEYIYLDQQQDDIAAQKQSAPKTLTTEKNLAYIIYTSGSTGQPKGVMLTQEGLINLVQAQIKVFDVQPTSRVLQYASFSFDASVSEIFMALISGATLYMISRETMLSQSGLLHALKSNEITTVTLPPSILAVLPEAELPHLQTIISAGEACTKNTVNRWGKSRRFINAYGPTESTVCTTANVVEDHILSDNIPIGAAIDNLHVYVVDMDMNPVPIGVPGELLIGGIGVARGYFDRPDLTAAKFIPNPWADAPGERVYRSGDLVRFLTNGKIEFLGRIDHQVKIRGLRVELGEIENTILEHPDVQNAVVLARRVKTGETRLAAYYISTENQDISFESMSRFMKKKLPPYMVPSAFMRMDNFPLTQNKKIDRRSFPDPFLKQQLGRKDIVKPKNDIERTIAEAWTKVLDLKQISIHDNFFEIGGHSLMMVKLHASLEEMLNTKFSVVELFQYPTIATQAKFLSSSKKENMATQNAQMRAVRQRDQIRAQRHRMDIERKGVHHRSRSADRASTRFGVPKGSSG